jgi:hypothetical protein
MAFFATATLTGLTALLLLTSPRAITLNMPTLPTIKVPRALLLAGAHAAPTPNSLQKTAISETRGECHEWRENWQNLIRVTGL